MTTTLFFLLFFASYYRTDTVLIFANGFLPPVQMLAEMKARQQEVGTADTLYAGACGPG
jgi:hypothetical protein